MDDLTSILAAYDAFNGEFEIKKFGSGHIHATYVIEAGQQKYILQAFNNGVFKFPERISSNQHTLSAHLGETKLPFSLPLPIKNKEGEYFTEVNGRLYRIFPFVEGVTKDAVDLPQQAELAAAAFGIFVRTFLDVPIKGLYEPIPDFHNLTARYQQLQLSVENTELIIDHELEDLIDFYLDQTELLSQYQRYQKTLPLRVTHSDTKINNLIFNEDLSKVNALIDLDTIMAGYIFYDFGDLVRTVTCTEDESSQNWGKIEVDMDKYAALYAGFCQPLFSHISKEERGSLPFGGEMMTYIMGLRFLADYLNGNIYYTIHYPEQNLHRALNQCQLLISLQQNRAAIDQIVEETSANIPDKH